MALQLKQYVELRGDNPLDAVIVGLPYNAWLVAQFAEAWGTEEAVKNYNLTRAQIYGALAFHYDNEAAIEDAIVKAEANLREISVDSRAQLDKIRRRKSL
jgi:uncharacterized protein (DUF433 family)